MIIASLLLTIVAEMVVLSLRSALCFLDVLVVQCGDLFRDNTYQERKQRGHEEDGAHVGQAFP